MTSTVQRSIAVALRETFRPEHGPASAPTDDGGLSLVDLDDLLGRIETAMARFNAESIPSVGGSPGPGAMSGDDERVLQEYAFRYADDRSTTITKFYRFASDGDALDAASFTFERFCVQVMRGLDVIGTFAAGGAAQTSPSERNAA